MPQDLSALTKYLVKLTQRKPTDWLVFGGDRVLFDAVRAYEKAVCMFGEKNNLNAAQVARLLKNPDKLLECASATQSLKDGSSKRDVSVIGKGRVATTTRVSRVKTAAVTKRVAKKSK